MKIEEPKFGGRDSESEDDEEERGDEMSWTVVMLMRPLRQKPHRENAKRPAR